MLLHSPSVFLGVLVLALSNVAGNAATATPDEAKSIKGAIERYVGHGDPSGPGPVTVTPSGDSYMIAIDTKQVLRAFQSFGMTIDSDPTILSAVPQDGGTWHVTSSGPQRATVSHAGQSISVVVNGMRFDGIYDPKVPAFTQGTRTYDSMSIASVRDAGGTQTRQEKQGQQTFSSTSPGAGLLDLDLKQSNAGIAQDMTLDTPAAPNKPARAEDIAVNIAQQSGTVSIQELQIRALTDLWAFFVAHPSRGAIAAAQTQLRDLLRQALPLFKTWSQQVSADHLAVVSPAGTFEAQSVGGDFDITGLTDVGRAMAHLKVEGLTIPTALVPIWAVDLLPSAAEVKQTLSGYRLDTAAREAVEKFDLTADQPFTPETLETLKTLVGPIDRMQVTIAPSHLTSKLVDLRFEGDVRFNLPVPDFHLAIRASGIDDAIKDIQGKAGGDPRAAQLMAVVMLAKGYGRMEPDRSVSWAVTKDGTGGIMVNGVALPIGPGR